MAKDKRKIRDIRESSRRAKSESRSAIDKAKNAVEKEKALKKEQDKKPAAEQPVEEKEPVQQDTRDGEAKFTSAPRQRSVGESILAQEMLYRNQGYEPTHQVCSVVGYLIGVDKNRFQTMPHSFLEKEVYDRADQEPKLRMIRLLCRERHYVLNTGAQGMWVQTEEIQELSRNFQKNITYSFRDKTVGDYLIRLNREIVQALNGAQKELQAMLPACVDQKYIAYLIRFPGKTNSMEANEIWNVYKTDGNKNLYPYQRYINIPLSVLKDKGGHPLNGDDWLVDYAYGAYHGTSQSFEGLWRLRRLYPSVDTCSALHDFLGGYGHNTYSVLIDGTSVTAGEVLGFLRELRAEEWEVIDLPVELYCCKEVYENWLPYIKEYENQIHPIEVSSTVMDEDRTMDVGINCRTTIFWRAPAAGLVLLTRDPAVFDLCWTQAREDQRSRLVLTGRQAADAILDKVILKEQNHNGVGFLEDLAAGVEADSLKLIEKELERQFPIRVQRNLQDILEEAVRKVPVDCPKAQRRELYGQLSRGLAMQVLADGSIRIVYSAG